jgi:fumarate hydratase subunit beta
MCAALDRGEDIPFDMQGACIYYAGPTQTPDGAVIGSIGPTTSSRMDRFSPRLLDMGLGIMIGKGERSDEVVKAIGRNKALYLCAVGGAGAYIANCVRSCEVIAYPELSCESVKRLWVEDFLVFCGIDSEMNSIFER